jgi:hypothetical protein
MITRSLDLIHHAAAWLPAHPPALVATLVLLAAVPLALIAVMLHASTEPRRIGGPVVHAGWDEHLPELDGLAVGYRARHRQITRGQGEAPTVGDAAGWGFSREPETEVLFGPVPETVEGWSDGAARTGELIRVHPAGGAA